jgi:metal-dependent amidase/aminoacylase/carboxypeptidase family protein
MAILLGTAEVLASLKKELKGTVKFIFQPAEEGPEEKRGAALMVKEGVLENPKVDVILAYISVLKKKLAKLIIVLKEQWLPQTGLE